MGTRKKKGAKSFQPVDFDAKFGDGVVVGITPQELPKKSFDEVVATIKKELDLVSIGLSKYCAMAIQFDRNKTPFCKVLGVVNKDTFDGKQAQELIRLGFQDFGNRFSGFVKDELRNLF